MNDDAPTGAPDAPPLDDPIFDRNVKVEGVPIPVIEAVEADGLVLSLALERAATGHLVGRATVQCTEPVSDADDADLCGEEISSDVDFGSGEQIANACVRCPACSARQGVDVLIPIVLLKGYEVEDELGAGEDEDVRRAIVVGEDGSVTTERVAIPK